MIIIEDDICFIYPFNIMTSFVIKLIHIWPKKKRFKLSLLTGHCWKFWAVLAAQTMEVVCCLPEILHMKNKSKNYFKCIRRLFQRIVSSQLVGLEQTQLDICRHDENTKKDRYKVS